MDTDSLLQFLGRLHPVVLHLPIGLIAGLVALELIALARRKPTPIDVRRTLALLLALSAVASVATGLLLASDGYDGALVERHRNLGLAVGVLSLVTAGAALARRSRRAGRVYAGALALTVSAIVPASHFGGEITHGVGFLTEPFRTAESGERRAADGRLIDDGPPLPDHDAAFAFIDSYCASCHGATRSRGGLVLTSIDAMLTGGDSGPALVPGDADASELVRRLRLAPDHDDRMPPPPRRQPSEEAVAALEAWVTALGSVDLSTVDGHGTSPERDTPVAPPVDMSAMMPVQAIPNAVRDALERLAERRVHVETIDPDTGGLWIDFAAARDATGPEIAALLGPLADQVLELGLASTAIDDETVSEIGPMSALARLDLSGTRVSAASLAALEGSPSLHTLVLHRVLLDDDAVEAIARLGSLRRLFVNGTGLGESSIAVLASRLPECEIVGEGPIDAVVLEVEEP